MDNPFGDMLKQKLAQAGGKVSKVYYQPSADYPGLSTLNDMYLTFTKEGMRFGAVILEPPKARVILVHNKDGKLIDNINGHLEKAPYCVVVFTLSKPYVKAGDLIMDDTLGEVYNIHLGHNNESSLKKVSTSLRETVDKLRVMILNTHGGGFQLTYISHRLLAEMQDLKFVAEDSRIYSLPMPAICAKTLKDLEEYTLPGLRRKVVPHDVSVDHQGNIRYTGSVDVNSAE